MDPSKCFGLFSLFSFLLLAKKGGDEDESLASIKRDESGPVDVVTL